MDFKRYLGKIQNKIKEAEPKDDSNILEEVKPEVVEEVKPEVVEEVKPEVVEEVKPEVVEEERDYDSEFNKSDFKPTTTHESKTNFDEFVDERILVSHNSFGDKEMKIKILEVSDETAPLASKFGDRVKLNKIIVTIKHLHTQQIEEGEFDIESIERELTEKRHYASSNRWVPTTDIKNGYVTNTRHTSLISDAAALDYITF